jgi:DNA processing protein
MGAANPRSVQLIRHYGSAGAVYKRLTDRPVSFLKQGEADALKTASLDKSQEILQECAKKNYRAVTLEDADYPITLKNIYNAPIVLFVSGELPKENELTIAIVGTREACEYSFKVARRLCTGLVQKGAIIISGMAIGIDKTAHTAAVETKGRTIGVLACGFNVDYPKFSTPFRGEIIDAGGAVVTELLPEQRGEKGYFNQRNRIMSGLSRGVVVIEAGEKSGCHITAAHAINQNRDLFCVPPPDIFKEKYRGVISYLRDGAIPVFDASDILNEYFSSTVIEYASDELAENTVEPTETTPSPAVPPLLGGELSPKPFNIIPEKPPCADLTELYGNALIVAEILQKGAQNVDYISEKSGLSADELSDLLLELEIDGVIESAAGSNYQLTVNN